MDPGSAGVTDHTDDRRVPVDRLTTTRPGVYFAHIVKGNCTKHGPTACECVHPTAEASTADLVVECLECRAEAVRAESLKDLADKEDQHVD